jgi:putative FmdB family regulatory protein
MPTYEYLCKACDHEFEKEQRITADAIKKCPSCKKMKVVRLISSGSSFQLKGGGWYDDGYHEKAAPKEKAAVAEQSSSSGSDAQNKSGSESKSESKGTESKSAETKPPAKADTKKSSDSSKK